MTKKCSKCKQELSSDCFRNNKSAKDGLQHWCRECMNAYYRSYFKKDKNYNKKAARMNEYYERNKTQYRENWRRWYQDNKHRPEVWNKIRAAQAIAQAVYRGKMQKGSCEVCGKKEAQAHHYLGYEREHWMSVKWLCHRHHREVHG